MGAVGEGVGRGKGREREKKNADSPAPSHPRQERRGKERRKKKKRKERKGEEDLEVATLFVISRNRKGQRSLQKSKLAWQPRLARPPPTPHPPNKNIPPLKEVLALHFEEGMPVHKQFSVIYFPANELFHILHCLFMIICIH